MEQENLKILLHNYYWELDFEANEINGFKNYLTSNGLVKELDTLNQFISIIDTLTENNITSDDFCNTDNLGYRLGTKNICYFDIGFGNYFDKLSNPIYLTVPKGSSVFDILKIKKGKELGTGMFGTAFDIGNNRVLKITTDSSEAVSSEKLIKIKKSKNIAVIYNVYEIISLDSNGKKLDTKKRFVIILEKLLKSSLIDKAFNNLDKSLINYLNQHINETEIDKIKYPIVKSFIQHMIKSGYSKTWDKFKNIINKENNFDFNDISDLTCWIRNSKTNDNEITDTVPDYVLKLLKQLQ